MENQIYEISYLLLPSISAEQISVAVAKLKDIIVSQNGTAISDENPVLIDLAYSMTKVVGTTRHKTDSGYFGWVKFEVGAEGISGIKKALDGNDIILRYLIIKTVRENTLLYGKMKLKSEERVKTLPTVLEDEVIVDVPVPEKEIIMEDLDKSIDDLVIV